MRRLGAFLLLALCLAGWWWLQPRATQLEQGSASTSQTGSGASAGPGLFGLPPEARDTLALIRRGGPYPHRQDGGVFGNREGRLPAMPRGYYREYTVATPGLGHRGARRIVTGGEPPAVYYYTDDHYDSFRRFEPGR